MGTTPIYGFPYPDPSDLVANYPALGQQLAEDVETEIAALGAGLSFITSSTFSAAASVSIDNCFTATYQNYLAVMEFTASANVATNARLRASGTDESGANYYWQTVFSSGTSVSGTGASGNTTYEAGKHSTGRNLLSLTIGAPAVATQTSFISECATSENTGRFLKIVQGQHSLTTAYDGLTILPASGTITGTIRIYGYQNA